jgi:hypothetical protein
MGWLVTPQRFLVFSRFRVACAILSGLAFLVTEAGRHVLRPYIRSSGLNDYGVTDSIGNLGGILVQIFFSLSILNPDMAQSYRLAAFFTIGYIGYEFLQPYLPRGTFDWNDVLGTVLGYCFAVPVIWILWRIFPQSGADSMPKST